MASGVERNLSVDDLVGGIWRLNQAAGGAFKRTDSEAAFQEFLKRIPSSSNLQAAQQSAGTGESGGNGASAPGGIGGYGGGYPTSTPLPLDTSLSGGHAPGMPRVPSLDFLRQLATVQQAGNSQAVPVKQEAHPATMSASTTPPAGLPAGLPSLSDIAALNASTLAALNNNIPLLNTMPNATYPNGAAPFSGLPAAHIQPHAATVSAAPMSANTANPRHSSNGPVSSVQGTASEDDQEEGTGAGKNETRKARRMLSNRESARRSRRRKQEHLGRLEEEINGLNEERKVWEEKLVVIEKRATAVEDENRRLKDENDRLRDELAFLRSELKGTHSRKGGSGQVDGEDKDVAGCKRQRASKE